MPFPIRFWDHQALEAAPVFIQQYTCLLFVEVSKKHKMRAKPALQRAMPGTLSGIARFFRPQKCAQIRCKGRERRPKMTRRRALMHCLGAPMPSCQSARTHMRMAVMSLASGDSRSNWRRLSASVMWQKDISDSIGLEYAEFSYETL